MSHQWTRTAFVLLWWLISLSVVLPGSVCVAACVRMSFLRLRNLPLSYILRTARPPMDTRTVCAVRLLCRDAVTWCTNTCSGLCCRYSVVDPEVVGYLVVLCSFLRNLPTVLHSTCTILTFPPAVHTGSGFWPFFCSLFCNGHPDRCHWFWFSFL